MRLQSMTRFFGVVLVACIHVVFPAGLGGRYDAAFIMPPSSCNCRQLHMRMNAHSTKASQQTLQAAQNRACARNRAPWSALRGWRAGCGRLRMDGLDRSLFDAPHCGIELQVAECMKDINREHWNRVVWESGGEGCTNPFLSWEFLNALEESESAHKDTGWAPQHLLAYDQESGEMVGCVPQYLKAHSYGEYVFDHTWARAYRMFSVNAQTSSVVGYYPKLQACVPFTPVTGPRLMARGAPELQKRVISCLVSAIRTLCNKSGISSAHVTFPTKSEWEVMGREGFLQRTGIQYHWHNAGYATFQEFLETLKQSKRKSIRQERSKIRRAGLTVNRLRGTQILDTHWSAFYQFYLNTVDDKWGQAYLTRDFFRILARDMPDQILLVLAKDQRGELGGNCVYGRHWGCLTCFTGTKVRILTQKALLVAGALNLVGGNCLYGRHWGCARKFDSLHFELCYYQAIEAAIEMKLSHVEAGAQGEHKISRGYRPTNSLLNIQHTTQFTRFTGTNVHILAQRLYAARYLPTVTYSAHYIPNVRFRQAVAEALAQERDQVMYTTAVVTMEESPYKEGSEAHLASQGIVLRHQTPRPVPAASSLLGLSKELESQELESWSQEPLDRGDRGEDYEEADNDADSDTQICTDTDTSVGTDEEAHDLLHTPHRHDR